MSMQVRPQAPAPRSAKRPPVRTGARAAAHAASGTGGPGSAPLKILVPIHRIDAGGVERVALRLADAWSAAGHEVTIVLGAPQEPLPEANGTDTPERRYWRVPTRFSTLSWRTPWMVWSLYSYLMERRCDVLFLPGNTYAVVGAAMKLLLGEHTPPMVLKVSNALHRPDMPVLERLGYEAWLRTQGGLFDRLVALSEPMRREVRACTQALDAQVRLIPNPVLTARRLAALGALPRAHPSVWSRHYLAAGRLAPQKNLALLLRAFARAARPGDRLTIAGEGPERGALERLRAELGLAEQVDFPGEVPAIDPLLAKVDALVLSSDYEGLPGIVVEALAAGLPILATDCCVSMATLVEEGRTGLLVPVGDEAALAQGFEALRGFSGDPARARALASRYEVASAAARYIEMMADLVAPALPAGAEEHGGPSHDGPGTSARRREGARG